LCILWKSCSLQNYIILFEATVSFVPVSKFRKSYLHPGDEITRDDWWWVLFFVNICDVIEGATSTWPPPHVRGPWSFFLDLFHCICLITLNKIKNGCTAVEKKCMKLINARRGRVKPSVYQELCWKKCNSPVTGQSSPTRYNIC